MKLQRTERKAFGKIGKEKRSGQKGGDKRSKPLKQPNGKGNPLAMPDGSGAVVLYEKKGTQFRSVAVIAVKAVLPEASQTPGWITVENVLMPHQLTFGERQPVWMELLRFGAYQRAVRVAKRRKA